MKRISMVTAACTATVALLAGCGGGQENGGDAPQGGGTSEAENGSAPENSSATEEERSIGSLTFAPPKGMVEYVPENDTLATLTMTIEDYDADTYEGDPPAVFVFEEDSNPIPSLVLLRGQMENTDPEAEFTTDSVDIPGAADASLMKSDYIMADGKRRLRWDLVIAGQGPESFSLRYSAYEDEFVEESAQAMIDSVRLEENN